MESRSLYCQFFYGPNCTPLLKFRCVALLCFQNFIEQLNSYILQYWTMPEFFLFIKLQSAEECDATGDAVSTKAGLKIFNYAFYTISNIY